MTLIPQNALKSEFLTSSASQKTFDVPFTFFINMGRGTSRWSFIKKKSSLNGNATPHGTLKLSNLKKLGLWNYFFMAVMNPQVGNTHPDIIQALKKSRS